jgi:hypothetical protein
VGDAPVSVGSGLTDEASVELERELSGFRMGGEIVSDSVPNGAQAVGEAILYLECG